MSEVSSAVSSKRPRGVLIATAFMLFSMFFGAGNLIFPPMLGASAGENFPQAIMGFIIGGVFLPALTIIAVAVSGSDVSDLSHRAGKVFGWFFPILVYLSIGAFYGLPRMGTVAYTTAFVPISGVDSFLATVVFNVAFFGIALGLAWHSSRILDSVGRVLTPVLLLFLGTLILRVLTTLEPNTHAGAPEFVETPVISGLLQGYLTMDSIAALAFGIIVIRALRQNGHVPEERIVSQTSVAAIIAAALLTIVYLGLGSIGRFIPNPESYENGAVLLTDAAALTMGDMGRIVFGLTVLAACLTTAVGLLAACSGFFNRLIPAVPYRAWLIIFASITFVFSILGLKILLDIAGPLIGFLYPIGITLIILTLLAPLFARVTALPVTFRVATTTATVWSALTTVASLEWLAALPIPQGQALQDGLAFVLGLSPMQDLQLGWVVPVALLALVSGVLDVYRGLHR